MLQIIQNMRLPILILISTASFSSKSTSLVTSDPPLFDATEDQLSIPFGDIFSSSTTFDSASDQFYSADDQWNLPEDSTNFDLPLADVSCSDHADDANLSLIAKLRSRAPNTGDTCAPAGTTKAEPEWQDGDSVINLIPDFPILVFPDILKDGLSPNACGRFTAVIMFPVCDSGHPKDRSISLMYINPYFPMYKLYNCLICTFFQLLFFFSFLYSSILILALFRLLTPLPPFLLHSSAQLAHPPPTCVTLNCIFVTLRKIFERREREKKIDRKLLHDSV